MATSVQSSICATPFHVSRIALMKLWNRKHFYPARLVCILVSGSLVLYALNAFCQDPDYLFDPDDTSSAIDLAKIPLEIDLFRRVGLWVQDAGFKKQFS